MLIIALIVHDPKSGVTRYAYDKNDNRIKQILPEGQVTLYEYDAAGNQTARLDASGQKIAYQYDALNRLTQADYYAADNHQTSVKTVHLTYDVVGNLASYDDGTTSATYTYDALGQKLSETVDYGAFTVSHSYEYYANGRKKSFTGPDGVKITYSYDENNRLSAIDIPNAGRVTYNTYHWNRPAKITLPGGSQIDLAYDPLMRLLSKAVKDPAQQFLMDYEYEHSPANNITKKTTEQGEYAYQYDELSRLTQATNPVLEDEHYTYDLLSNRLTASGVEASYDANNALLSYGDAEFEYDASGNVVKKTDASQVTHYEYNVEGRLVRVIDGEDNLIAEYDYDPFGRRIWKEVEGVRTYFVYAAEGLIGEYDDSGVEIKGYGYRPDSMWTTNPLFQKTNGSYYWYQNDHLGTPQKLLDSQGNVVWAAVYEAFGKAQVDVDLVENHLRFAGQYFDGETGLHYNWHRYYEPTTGRYLSVDPIPSVNLYVYVSGNPVSFVDPFGLSNLPLKALIEFFAPAMAIKDEATAIAKKTAIKNRKEARKAKIQALLRGDNARGEDAFRHCLGSCMSVVQLGVEKAKFFGDLNEVKGAFKGLHPGASAIFDLYNNECGYAYGKVANNTGDCIYFCWSGIMNGPLARDGYWPQLMEETPTVYEVIVDEVIFNTEELLPLLEIIVSP
ncbi:MAG: RHS repeat-associated core domain-containing protein [Candidatus Parabeggiatoa sp.]|nr:RHS repeat-associated core domain-containing protein [Candidatus Parabeggiatoa sp.]